MRRWKISLQKQTFELSQAHNEHKQGLIVYAWLKIHDKALCEDLVQETFLKAWKYILKGEPVLSMKTFLYHILNALIIDEYRKRKTLSLDMLLEKGYEPLPKDMSHFISTLDGRAVLKKLTEIPEKYRTVINLRYKEDRSVKEISDITGQSTNTVSVQLHRGLEKLFKLQSSSKK